MLCLIGFELHSRWVPLNDLFQFCAVAVHTSPKSFSCPLPPPPTHPRGTPETSYPVKCERNLEGLNGVVSFTVIG